MDYTRGKYFQSPMAPAPSRRAKIEQKNLMRQTAIFGVLAVVALIIFFAVILPGVIRFITKPAGPSTEVKGPKPIPPTLQAPVDATNSAKLAITGYGQPKAQVVIVNNNNETTTTNTLPDGTFSTDITLEKGNNSIGAFLKADDGQESDMGQTYQVIFDNEAPKITFEDPKDGKSVQGKAQQNTTLKGSTEPGSKIYVNDRLSFPKADGTFAIPFRLEVGDNGIVFKVVDQAGNTTEQKITVKYSE